MSLNFKNSGTIVNRGTTLLTDSSSRRALSAHRGNRAPAPLWQSLSLRRGNRAPAHSVSRSCLYNAQPAGPATEFELHLKGCAALSRRFRRYSRSVRKTGSEVIFPIVSAAVLSPDNRSLWTSPKDTVFITAFFVFFQCK